MSLDFDLAEVCVGVLVKERERESIGLQKENSEVCTKRSDEKNNPGFSLYSIVKLRKIDFICMRMSSCTDMS